MAGIGEKFIIEICNYAFFKAFFSVLILFGFRLSYPTSKEVNEISSKLSFTNGQINISSLIHHYLDEEIYQNKFLVHYLYLLEISLQETLAKARECGFKIDYT